MDTIKIEKKGADKNTLNDINRHIRNNPSTKLSLIVDNRYIPADDNINNLEVLRYTPHARNVSIFSNSSEPIESFDNISLLENLDSLYITGCIKKNITLTPLYKFSEIRELTLDFVGLSSPSYKWINELTNLNKLRVHNIDMAKIIKNNNLTDLWVQKSILSEKLMIEKYPNLKKVGLVGCRKVEDLSFINNLNNLEKLYLWYMPQLKEIPILDNLNKLETLSLIHAKNLESINNLFQLDNINFLEMTDIKLAEDDIKKLHTLKSIKRVNIRFVDKKSNELLESIMKRNTCITPQCG